MNEKIEGFLRDKYYPNILQAVKDDKSFAIDFEAFDRYDPVTADMMLEEPELVLKSMDEAAENMAGEKITTRIRNLPESRQIRIRNLRAKHIGKFLQIDTTIRSATDVRPQIYEAVFQCPDCSANIVVLQESTLLQKPTVCECGRRGDFPVTKESLVDTRWITGIEPFEVTSGEQPGEISIFLKGDLTTPKMQRKTDPGSSLRITGVLKQLPKRIKGRLTTKMDIYIEANHVEHREVEFEELEITPQDEQTIKGLSADPDIYEKLKLSIAPGIYGFDEIKEAIALQLFGGIQHIMPDGSRVRGNIHMLLTGDPGIGKSLDGQSKILHNSKDGPEFTNLGKLVDSALCGKNIVKTDDGAEISLENKSGVKVLTLDTKTGDVEWKPVTAFIRHKSPSSMLSITTKSGRDVVATGDHSFVALDTFGNIKPIKGSELNSGTYLPVPLGAYKEMITEVGVGAQKKITNAKLLPDKIKLDWNFGFFLGMFIAEGDFAGGHINISSKNSDRRKIVSDFAASIGLSPIGYPDKINISSRKLVSWLSSICYDNSIGFRKGVKGSGSIRKKLPDFCFFGTKEFLHGLLSGLFSGDGYFVNMKPSGSRTLPNLKLGYATISKPLADGLLELLSLAGIFAQKRTKNYVYKGEKRKCYELNVVGSHAEKLLTIIKMVGKERTVKRFSAKDSFDVMPCADLLYRIVRVLGFSARKHENAEKRRAFAAMMRTVRSRGRMGRRRMERIYKILAEEAVTQGNIEAQLLLANLRKVLNSPVVWDQIRSIDNISFGEKYVYDVSIDGTETFVANNLVVHNTVLLKLVSSVMPRGKYVSGSGVTGAGLTASVRKDEIIGTWVLEAGALILANKSVISIDEFDKMSRDDQTAMHEAMSVETISIAKASIVATLPAQTAVLAGANPQYGRFDTYKSVAEQIQIPETLLSRFDLKFALIDKPDKAMDERLTDHIIMSRIMPDKILPVIDVHLLRKYIAYAKQNVKGLVLMPDAADEMKRFYIEMRSPGGSGGPIGITLRQYEALLRMAEASAKIRLDTHVRKQDAERAIRLMMFSLRQLGFDTESGMIDIDKIESGVTTSKRKRITRLVEIIERMQKETKEIAVSDVFAEAQTLGISEKDAEETMEELVRKGELFHPKPGFVRKV